MKILEKILAARFLREVAEHYGNHGCNDVDEIVWQSWSIDERKEFVKEYHEWNGDPEEYDSDWLHLPDHAIMDFLAHKLTI